MGATPPYAEIYGQHPRTFVFAHDGSKLPIAITQPPEKNTKFPTTEHSLSLCEMEPAPFYDSTHRRSMNVSRIYSSSSHETRSRRNPCPAIWLPGGMSCHPGPAIWLPGGRSCHAVGIPKEGFEVHMSHVSMRLMSNFIPTSRPAQAIAWRDPLMFTDNPVDCSFAFGAKASAEKGTWHDTHTGAYVQGHT